MLVPYGADHLAGVLAQTTGGDAGWIQLLNYGVLGLILLGLLTNRLALPREVKAALERATAAESALAEERRAHNETRAVVFDALTREVQPALVRATLALESHAKPG